MASLITFESSWKKSEEREELNKRREDVLENARRKFELEEQRKAEAKARGEDTWMLPSVTERIKQEENELKHAKSKKKKKKLKKEKKKKKKRKRSSSSSSDDSDSEAAWVEKTNEKLEKPCVVKGPKMERESWMVSPLDFSGLGGMSRAELKAKKQAEEEKKKQMQTMMDMPGQHERELNPFWKAGGSGMPEEKSRSTVEGNTALAGDGGVGWLRKALRRCQEQAEEEGKSVEEVAAERYGSLKQLKARLKEAEDAVQGKKYKDNKAYSRNVNKDKYKDDEKDRGNRLEGRSYKQSKVDKKDTNKSSRNRSSGSSESDDRSNRSRSRSRERRKYKDRGRSKSGSRENRSRSRDRTKYRDRSRSRKRDRKSRSRSRDKKKYKDRNRSRSRDRRKNRERSRSRHSSYESDISGSHSKERERKRSRSKSRDRKRYKDNRSRSRSGSNERKSGDRKDTEGRSQQRSSLKALSGRFKKPGDDTDWKEEAGGGHSGSRRFHKPGDDVESTSDVGSSSSSSRRYKSSQPAWKKKVFIKPEELTSNEKQICEKKFENSGSSTGEGSRSPVRSDKWRKVKDESGTSKIKQESESSSSSSESETSSSDTEGEMVGQSTEQQEPPPKILTEQEMNQLGAKLVRAELMGNEALASKIKHQLDQARASAETAAKQPVKRQPQVKPEDGEEETVVVLTRTDRHGNVRPLDDRKHIQEPRKGRKKKQKIQTHMGDKGERVRYFQDDDKLGLKDMVEQEKLGTAEDANMMFARLAGRSGEKLSDDYQVDDMFISRASHKEADSRQEDRDRASAIFEHKKISEAIEKCQFCFNKVAKHLIIAIGKKCYLCLPNHRSLTAGHCLIIPMQHVSQGTLLDEDVWDEIQVFRKSLTKMFEDQGEDCVFMEMSRNIRHHPHMVLECIPLPKEVGDLSPIYFKKAIQECEAEWSQNKKLVELKGRDVRKAIPKGFPYFSVDFGLQSGFAHVIEDEKEFPPYFGREVVGGMLDVGPELWRKPHKENFEEQRKKVLKFADWWKPFDWTQKLKCKEDDT